MIYPLDDSGVVNSGVFIDHSEKPDRIEDNIEKIFKKTFPFSLFNFEEVSKYLKIKDKFFKSFELKNITKNETLAKQNSYILVKGSILIIPVGEGLKKGKNREHSSVHEFVQEKADSSNVIETITEFTYFGSEYDLLGQEIFQYIVNQDSTVVVIKKEEFKSLLYQYPQFKISIYQNIFHKCKILKPILKLQRFIHASVRENQEINLENLISFYMKLKSKKHFLCNDFEKIDYGALEYALSILPDEIINAQKIFFTTKDNSFDYTPVPMYFKKRKRNIFYLKSTDSSQLLVILENYETDLFDFISLLLIVIVEVEKIQNYIKFQHADISRICLSETKYFEALMNKLKDSFLSKALDYIFQRALNPQTTSQYLSNIPNPHTGVQAIYGDFIKTISIPHFKFKPTLLFEENSFDCKNNRIEEWSQILWNEMIQFIKDHKSIDKSKIYLPKDLISLFDIHIIIGSKRGLMQLVDPYIYTNKAKIINDVKYQSNLKGYKTVNNEDQFTSYAQEYLNNELKDENNQKKRKELLEKNGIKEVVNKSKPIEPTIVLIDPSKLDPNIVSSGLKDTLKNMSNSSQNVIFLCLGYSYGVKAKEIAKQLFLLFGKVVQSFSLVGKATCLSGKDRLVVAEKIINYETSESIGINTEHIDIEDLKRLGITNVNLGKILTLNVRVFQNETLLNYYGKVIDCKAGEMEAFYYAKQIQQLKDNNLVNPYLTQTYGYFIEEENQSEGNYYDSDKNLKMNFAKKKNQNFNTGFLELSALYIYIFNLISLQYKQ